MNQLRNMSFIDLFAGIGGFRIALEKFGANCVFSSEKDKYAKITYEANFGDIPAGDITKIKSEDIPPHDILCAGFPCQPFSISGKQKGFEDSRGTLFFEIARIVKYHRPKMLFLENVANLRRHKDGKTIDNMIKILKDLEYNVFTEILNASDFGVPQSRKRLYFVCFRKELGIMNFSFPKPTLEDIALEDILLPDSETEKYIIDRDDIYMKDITINDRKLKPIRIGTINKGGQGERIYSPKGHAITLSAHGGGPGAKTGAYLVNNKVRKLAPRECALAQGFPPDFKIPVSDSQAWKQFGNSVAVPVLIKILEKVSKYNLKTSSLKTSIEAVS
ncbi:DNA cytosine methyltransferase [Caldisalinibacter kiritimatiensis]|uniref:Cytosine-specific methyltransferase n=1 Tax=Caldisalinibacter kiritimatiensis TaxID=1304284 RepID=R1CUS4_9FIRM|nr:DNA (cytosine-5-)-methyltransferase [Caldisalinibacter kiritimatiensis]EOD00409.1 DNA-cytosine methyltransferase [Caldisalinibacter kiritimatiensis]